MIMRPDVAEHIVATLEQVRREHVGGMSHPPALANHHNSLVSNMELCVKEFKLSYERMIRLEAMVLKLEWIQDSEIAHKQCPCCKSWQYGDGHYPGCALEALVLEIKKEKT